MHKWRAEEDAILVGTHTVLVDNPSLTVREWTGRHPKRVLIDKSLATDKDGAIYSTDVETFVFNALKTDWSSHIKYIELENFDLYLPQNILYQLHLMDVQSLLIEGGAKTLQLFIDAGLWDEARIFTSDVTWQDGILAPKIGGALIAHISVGTDTLEVFRKS